MFTFHKNYFILAVLLFLLEVFIALFIHDRFIRPYVGDLLVVIMLYCTLKAFFKIRVLVAAVIVLLFALLIEFLQYIKIPDLISVKKDTITSIALGSHFDWVDIFFYTLGMIIVILFENLNKIKGKEFNGM